MPTNLLAEPAVHTSGVPPLVRARPAPVRQNIASHLPKPSPWNSRGPGQAPSEPVQSGCRKTHPPDRASAVYNMPNRPIATVHPGRRTHGGAVVAGNDSPARRFGDDLVGDERERRWRPTTVGLLGQSLVSDPWRYQRLRNRLPSVCGSTPLGGTRASERGAQSAHETGRDRRGGGNPRRGPADGGDAAIQGRACIGVDRRCWRHAAGT